MKYRRFATASVSIGVALLLSAAAVARTGQASTSRTKLITLGTGTPAADPDRFGPATVVLVDDVPYLVDCGVGVVRRWAGVIRSSRLPLRAWDLKTAFITHLHSDHTLGYGELIFTQWTLEGVARPRSNPERRPLEMYGPAGLRAMTEHTLAAFAEDIRIRTGAGGEQAGSSSPVVNVHEIEPGIVFKDERVTVTAFRVPHGTWPQAFGFRFATPDKSIVISGDTAYSREVARQCNGCDILVHEGGRADDASPYFRTFHTTAEELGRLAVEARPKLLILTHQRDANAEGLRIIQSIFKGRVIVASDLTVFD